jgi:hypothetical protein
VSTDPTNSPVAGLNDSSWGSLRARALFAVVGVAACIGLRRRFYGDAARGPFRART